MTTFFSKNVAISLLITIVSYQLYNNPNSILNKRLRAYRASDGIPYSPSLTLESASTLTSNKLSQHSKLFENKEIIKVNEQVYVGIGYGLANIIVIEADSSFIIVDTLESINGAKEFRDDFNQLYNKNNTECKGISAIIFTHYHADHTQGTTAFIDDPSNPPVIIAHELTEQGLLRVNSIQSSIVYTRASRQFGTHIKAFDEHQNWTNSHSHEIHSPHHHHSHNKLHINSGIGPKLLLGDAWEKSFLLPTKVIDSKQSSLTIDGVTLDIYHAPGETDDQIFIYLPQSGTLLPADNIYQTFPNLYAIRGSPTRDARKWSQSLDMMRYLYLSNPNGKQLKYMVPSHTRPVIGFNAIYDVLTVYRDGIQYIHDQTMRFMNKGLTPNEMLCIIKDNMPNRLLYHPWLQEYYGTIDWSIRGIFTSYLGWFSGDAVDLFPLKKSKIGQNMVELGVNIINNVIKNGVINKEDITDEYVIKSILSVGEDRVRMDRTSRDDCQWALDIASNIMHIRDDVILGSEHKYSDDSNSNNNDNNNNDNGEVIGTVRGVGSSGNNRNDINMRNDAVYMTLSDEVYKRAKDLRIEALECMAGYQTSANGRNYYLTSALEDSGNFRIKPTKKAQGTVIHLIGLDVLFDAMQVRFKYDRSKQIGFTNKTSCFVFDITNDKLELPKDYQDYDNDDKVYSWYKLEMRDGVIEVTKGGDLMTVDDSKFGWLLSRDMCENDASLVVNMKADVYKELVSRMKRSPGVIYAMGDIKVIKGSIIEFQQFSTLFEKELPEGEVM